MKPTEQAGVEPVCRYSNSTRTTFREIRLEGDLALDPAYVPPDPSLPVVHLRAVLEQLDAASDAGARAVLLVVDSLGGDAWAGYALYDALQAFSEDGGHVVAYVKGTAGSNAAVYILGADRVVVHPDAVIHPHGSGIIGPDCAELRAVLGVDARLAGAIYAAHTFARRDDLVRWNEQPGEPLGAQRAFDKGFADLIGDLEAARELADELAIGVEVVSRRQCTLSAVPPSDEQADTLEAARELGAALVSAVSNDWPTRPILAGAFRRLAPSLGAAGEDLEAALGRGYRHLRLGMSIGMLFGKIPTGIKQFLGILTSAKEVKRKHMVSGIRQFFTKGWREVMEQSGEFRHVDKQLDRDARELFVALQGRFSDLGRARAQIIEWGAMPIMLCQKTVNAITWYAAREQALEQGHADPVAYADSVVRMTQTGGGVKDLAAVQRDTEAWKMLTVMFGYKSVLYNLITERLFGETALAKTREVFARTWWLLLTPALVLELLFNGVDDDEDAEDVAKRVALEFALQPIATIPGLGEAADAASHGGRMEAAPWLATIARTGASLVDVAEGDADVGDVKQFVTAVGVVFKIPTPALWNYGDYTRRLIEGELEEPVQDLLFRSPSRWE